VTSSIASNLAALLRSAQSRPRPGREGTTRQSLDDDPAAGGIQPADHFSSGRSSSRSSCPFGVSW
jgi:hypothetical protein